MITTVFVTAKCSDVCNVNYLDENGNKVGERDGYVPDWMPEDHCGDYVEIEIDITTGQILNWKKPTQKQLKDSMD